MTTDALHKLSTALIQEFSIKDLLVHNLFQDENGAWAEAPIGMKLDYRKILLDRHFRTWIVIKGDLTIQLY